jgi:2-aminoadipate transaminase
MASGARRVQARHVAAPASSVADIRRHYAARVAGISGSLIDASTSLIQASGNEVVRLAMGSPAADFVPVGLFERLLGEVAREGAAAFDYGPTEGEQTLRAELLRLLAARGEDVAPDSLLITTGGMQGLDLVCKLFLDPGDLVVVESPTYTNGAATISGYEGRILEVPCDADGMDVDALAELVAAAGAKPKLIYAIPTFQNPSGTTLTRARRERLIELAEQWDSLVLEDDPYGWVRFEGEELPTLRALAAGRVDVITVRTFSKILAPGLRVGWTMADPHVIARMVDARSAMDTCTNTLQQLLVARFLAGGHLDGHLSELRAEYRRRKVAMQASLHEQLAGLGARWTDPQGGFFLWLTLPEDVSTPALFPLALEEGVAFVPGPAFSVGGSFTNALRLAFSAEAPERARDGLVRLRTAIDRLGAA